MLSDSIRRWNPWWAQGEVEDKYKGVERGELRSLKDGLKNDLIKSVIGPRRAGKTTLLYQTIDHLIQDGVPPKDILLLNFDDYNIYETDFDRLMAECGKINPNISHLFLDEVQEREGWQRWVRTIYDTDQYDQIFITGSSSYLLQEEMSRILTGRHVTCRLLPFSFKEYLWYNGWEDFDKDFIEYNKDKILYHLSQYLNNGGFPETLGMKDMERDGYLNNLFDDIVARDISARHGAEYHITRRIAHYVVSNITSNLSYHNIAEACGIATATVSKYMDYMESAYLLYPLTRFSYKLKEQMRYQKKYYAIDNGFADVVSFRFSENRGQRAENAVFLDLLRKGSMGSEIYYWKDKSGKEVDFVTKNKEEVDYVIQVCWDISRPQTKKREFSSLTAALDKLNVSEGYILTENTEGEETIDGKTIHLIPLWKWFLDM
ncbi:MAG: ATP-binding protein [Thermoplasmata archaeon]